MLRLFYKYIPLENLYAVDPWESSLKHCQSCGIQANLARIDEISPTIPFNVKFDLVIAFSVFTHLSERSALAGQRALRQAIDDHGLLVITLRPFEYIRYFLTQHTVGASAEDLEKLYKEDGFVFITISKNLFPQCFNA